MIGRLYCALALAFVLMSASDLPAATYNVGPGQSYGNVGDVPWESLAAGDTVRIHYRATPYREKWVLCRQGTDTNWIVVQGVPDAQGNLPIIDGSNATTRAALNFWNEERAVIKIGGANSPPDTTPRYIRVENLDIRGGRPPFTFTGRYGLTAYAVNCASIYVEKGENIVVRNCILRDCGNGFFCAASASNVLVEACTVYDNGNVGSIYEHNSYTESHGITFQFNHYGPLRTGCSGNNLKDRSAGCVIRYNWIESGNRQLDLVDSGDPTIYNSPDYRSTFVYGNILIEPVEPGNRQICHYGGDSGTLACYRKGTLHFFNNTVISTRTNRTTLLNLSSTNETADCRNNVVYTTMPGSNLEICNNNGPVHLRNNWLPAGWVNTFGAGVVSNLGGNISGSAPGFIDASNQVFELSSTSACINVATSLPPSALPAHVLTNEYVKHVSGRPRYVDGALDMGAFEFNPDTDDDGMPDVWERLYAPSLTNMTAVTDSDHDGSPDRDEYRAGTLPTNANSRLAITSLLKSGTTHVVLAWQSASGRVYAVELATNLPGGAWVPAFSSIPAALPANAYTTRVDGAGNVFYRITVE